MGSLSPSQYQLFVHIWVTPSKFDWHEKYPSMHFVSEKNALPVTQFWWTPLRFDGLGQPDLEDVIQISVTSLKSGVFLLLLNVSYVWFIRLVDDLKFIKGFFSVIRLWIVIFFFNSFKHSVDLSIMVCRHLFSCSVFVVALLTE